MIENLSQIHVKRDTVKPKEKNYVLLKFRFVILMKDVRKKGNDHLIEFQLIEIVFFQLIESFNN
jgi:hypothetical protein